MKPFPRRCQDYILILAFISFAGIVLAFDQPGRGLESLSIHEMQELIDLGYQVSSDFSPDVTEAYGADISRNQGPEDNNRAYDPACFLSYPAVCPGDNDSIWVAVIARPDLKQQIWLYHFTECPHGITLKDPLLKFEIPDVTGIDRPSITRTKKGCFLIFPVEQQEKWRLAYSFIIFSEQKEYSSEIKYLETEGNVNILPSVTCVSDRYCVAWEANPQHVRQIYTAWILEDGSATLPYAISTNEANSYNPDIIASEDETVFVAWDSTRNQEADLYGAYYRHGTWTQEVRLTRDPRIERHVNLAVFQNKFWMAWQAQSFVDDEVNRIVEQRIFVAKIEDGHLVLPQALFDKVSLEDEKLLSPRIFVDSKEQLWLTARRSKWWRGGWEAKVWTYTKCNWFEYSLPFAVQGRTQPAPLCPIHDGMALAIQFDNIPDGLSWFGPNPDWDSNVSIVYMQGLNDMGPLQLEQETVPETQFSLPDYFLQKNSMQARQTTTHNGINLTLYYGDLHNHTTISGCMPSENQPIHDLCANQRDFDILDFAAPTDHGYSFDNPRWQYYQEQIRNNSDPGVFITLIGQEWTSNHKTEPPGYGHHNIIYFDSSWDTFYDAWEKCDNEYLNPRDLWDMLNDQGASFITIPHQLAEDPLHNGCLPKNWNFYDERAMPVAEICQYRGSYEYLHCPLQAQGALQDRGHYLRDAWSYGIIIGTIASSDHYGGGGKAGVWAENLTAQDLKNAFMARHTFGTSGAKIALFFTSDSALMGDLINKHDNLPIDFQIQAAAGTNISNISVFRGYTYVGISSEDFKGYSTIANVSPMTPVVNFSCTDFCPPPEAKLIYYYVRVTTSNDEYAWSSPIWFARDQRFFVPSLQPACILVLFCMFSFIIIRSLPKAVVCLKQVGTRNNMK
ncbi:DUF3604 domain-containing protein [bacterium]|nr:DUF3604 domain-containing protein [bacterium]